MVNLRLFWTETKCSAFLDGLVLDQKLHLIVSEVRCSSEILILLFKLSRQSQIVFSLHGFRSLEVIV